MKQRRGVYFLTIGILVFADLCYAASEEYPMVSSILNEARALRISGDVYKADGLLTRAQRIAPRSADVYLEMAYLRKAQGDYTGLREVVDFGADIADGPPASISQLRILRDKLTVLLPLDSETPFQLPPAVAVKSESIDEEVSKQSKSIEPSSDIEPAKSLADSVKEENLVGTDSNSAPSGQSKKVNRQAQPKEQPASADIGSSDSYQLPRLLDRASDKPEKSVARAVSIVGQRPNDDFEKPDSVTSAETISVPPQTKEIRAQLVGLGILARPQSGSWISRGSIEREY